ncbi:glucosidase 2 subunit beta [Photinus pyralis]|uniref:Glucosidase II beta subunit N-terminal domain-containing protein n=1 Tax=Photinus pyralis TaxID=7054 RepID=A0A1Y1MBH8_PHOPY|nr:glucosidase 2 subunit beta [Photinus pyralis]
MSQKYKINFFSRKKLHFFLKPIIILSVIFIIYQLIMFIQLTKDVNKELPSPPNLVLGTHPLQSQFYTPQEGQFSCITSKEKISFDSLNDNYCDCLDGSDEPGTNACSNGQFFCTEQTDSFYPKLVPSTKVNDGICDCCDGSDEWLHKVLPFRLSDAVQDKLKRYQSPCSYKCNKHK